MAGGATTAPTAVPALMMPIARDRSFAGNHSATAFVAAGNPPPSPTPSRNPPRGGERKPPPNPTPRRAARPQRVDERPAARVHQRVREQERRLELRELGVAERNVPLDRGNGHRQRLAIEITDSDRGAEDAGDAPADDT